MTAIWVRSACWRTTMTRSTASRRARNSDSVMIGGRRRPDSRPSRRRCRLASSRVEPLTARTSLSATARGGRLGRLRAGGLVRRVARLTLAAAPAAASAPLGGGTAGCLVSAIRGRALVVLARRRPRRRDRLRYLRRLEYHQRGLERGGRNRLAAG